MDRITLVVQPPHGSPGLMQALRAMAGGFRLRHLVLAVLLAIAQVQASVFAQSVPQREDIRPGQLPTASRHDIARLVEGVFDTASKLSLIHI